MSKDDLLDPKMDFIFKRIFGSENDTDILIRFLNAIFESKDETGEYDPIVEVEILNNEIAKKSIEDKYSILDIKARTSKGEVINIEIQRKDEGNILKRSIYYICKLMIEQLESGDDYTKLNRGVSIVIMDFVTDFIKSPDFHNNHKLKNMAYNDELTDLIELHYIELPKMQTFDENDILQLFLQFLRDPKDVAVEKKSVDIKELSKAKEKLVRLSRDPKTREEFEAREKSLKDKTSALNYAQNKGIKEGIGIGEAKAQVKVDKAEKAKDKAEKAKAKAEKAKAEAELRAKEAESRAKEAEAEIEKAKAEAELQTKLGNATNLLKVLDDETIAASIGLEVSQVTKLRAEVEG